MENRKLVPIFIGILCFLCVICGSVYADYDDGTGADGALNVAADFNINTQTQQGGRGSADAVNFSADVSNGVINNADNSIILSAAPTGLAVNDEVLIINLKDTSGDYTNVGNYETKKISAINANTITFTQSISNTYGNAATQKIMVQRVPNYTSVTVSAGFNLTADDWNGTKGGVIFFRAKGTVTVAGTIHMNNKGFIAGASGGLGGGYGGETYNGQGGNGGAHGAAGSSLQGGGGGGGGNTNVGGGGTVGSGGGGGGAQKANGNGGGGGYGSPGGRGTGGIDYTDAGTGEYGVGGTGGTSSGNSRGGGGGGGTVGTSTLSKLYLGSGSGAQGGQYTSDYCNVSGAAGVDGGGIIFIKAYNIVISGAIQSKGQNGNPGANSGGSGGGSGGTIYLAATNVTVGTSLVVATGGTGGNGAGGAGGVGRIRINYFNPITGTTNPAAYTSFDLTLDNHIKLTNPTSIVSANRGVTMGQSIAYLKFDLSLDNTANNNQNFARWKRFRIDKLVSSGNKTPVPDDKIEVQVWVEKNNNGHYDAGDTFITKGQFKADLVQAGISSVWLNMNRFEITTTARTFYIVYKLSNDIGGGQKCGLDVANNSYMEFEDAFVSNQNF